MASSREAGDYRWVGVGVVLVWLMSARHGSGQQQCTTYASSLYACFPYVQKGNSTQVGADCCTPLRSIVETRPDCVCTLNSFLPSIQNVNVTRAYELSKLCNIVSNATISSCNGTAAPAPAAASEDHNGAFTLHSHTTFHVILVGIAVLVYLLNQP